MTSDREVWVSQSVGQVRDELLEAIEPLLPIHDRDPRGSRPRVDDRVCFGAIVFVLFTGMAGWHLPRELGCSPGDRPSLAAGMAARGRALRAASGAAAATEPRWPNRLEHRRGRRQPHPRSSRGLDRALAG
jgi:hypothetical protein